MLDCYRPAARVLAFFAATSLAPSVYAESRIEEVPLPDGGVWKITISPGTTSPDAQSDVRITPGPVANRERAEQQPADDSAPATTRSDRPTAGASYRSIYASIPYRYSSYLGNPAYRHDATMELLLGQPRSASSQGRATAFGGGRPHGLFGPSGVNAVAPYTSPFPLYPFGYYDFSRGPYSRYQGLFGYRGGYRSMYYVNGGYSSAYGPSYW